MFETDPELVGRKALGAEKSQGRSRVFKMSGIALFLLLLVAVGVAVAASSGWRARFLPESLSSRVSVKNGPKQTSGRILQAGAAGGALSASTSSQTLLAGVRIWASGHRKLVGVIVAVLVLVAVAVAITLKFVLAPHPSTDPDSEITHDKTMPGTVETDWKTPLIPITTVPVVLCVVIGGLFCAYHFGLIKIDALQRLIRPKKTPGSKSSNSEEIQHIETASHQTASTSEEAPKSLPNSAPALESESDSGPAPVTEVQLAELCKRALELQMVAGKKLYANVDDEKFSHVVLSDAAASNQAHYKQMPSTAKTAAELYAEFYQDRYERWENPVFFVDERCRVLKGQLSDGGVVYAKTPREVVVNYLDYEAALGCLEVLQQEVEALEDKVLPVPQLSSSYDGRGSKQTLDQELEGSRILAEAIAIEARKRSYKRNEYPLYEVFLSADATSNQMMTSVWTAYVYTVPELYASFYANRDCKDLVLFVDRDGKLVKGRLYDCKSTIHGWTLGEVLKAYKEDYKRLEKDLNGILRSVEELPSLAGVQRAEDPLISCQDKWL